MLPTSWRYFGGKDKSLLANMLRKKPLQLSPSAKKLSKVIPGSIVGSLARGEIYNTSVARPPGISNVGNICYASSVIQCLFNHPTFRELCYDIVDQHPQQCFECSKPGNSVKSYNKSTEHSLIAILLSTN